MIQYEAEEKNMRCKLKSDYGGAQCGYSVVCKFVSGIFEVVYIA